ncbi:MAG: pyridoxamine 5'-phosphate oxidase family protein [Elusimicrobiales bacterium]|nr:pyridoxamine 5'-phosphate oxidase family protein [Elusimicrobiales bacterium]
MFKKMRRADRQLSRPEADAILAKGIYGVLLLIGENGYPYGVPVNYVYMNNAIYFHCALEGAKLDCIRACNKVSFCVVTEAVPLPEQLSTRYQSAIAFGTAREVSSDEKMPVLMALLKKYAREFLEKGKERALNSLYRTAVIAISLDNVTGKARS